MICNVTYFEKVERDDEMPYYILKADGIEGDADADVLDEDGCINPFAMMSRKMRFTKTLFPSTDKQCEQLEKTYTVDGDGNVSNGAKVRLHSHEWASPVAFCITKDESVTGFYEIEETITETVTKNGKKMEVEKTRYTPKVFKTVNITVFEDKNGNCVENGGDADGLCKRAYERAIANGAYIPLEEMDTDTLAGIVE